MNEGRTTRDERRVPTPGTRRATMARFACCATALLIAADAAAQPAAQPGTYVIRNATIVPVSGPRIPNGSIVIQNGRIGAVGASVQAPAGAQVIDGAGLYVFPGMIDGGTQLGLTEIGSVPGSTDTRELGDFNPALIALTAVNVTSELIPVTRVNGVTTAITGASGGVMNGNASLIDLWGWTPEQMGVKQRVGQVMSYPGGGGRGRGGGGGRFGGGGGADEASRQIRELRGMLADAKAYSDMRARLASAPQGTTAPRVNRAMEALGPAVRGEEPVIFDVESEDQIRGVLALADTFHLKVILRGAREAWRLADTLAARRIPVIVGPETQPPDGDDPYDAIYANPGVLTKAGVKIAFQTSSASDSRSLPYEAALATAFGLDTTDAIKALTINAAEIFGVADRYGTIETGKVANLIVTTGNPLDVRSTLKYMFIRGEQVPLTDRHSKLYEQFKGRPKQP
jgi:imidazolonepropionase-like amidohydrolase